MERLQRATPRPCTRAERRRMIRNIRDNHLERTGESLPYREACDLFERHVGRLAVVYMNDTYTVYVNDAEWLGDEENAPDVVHLSIKRNDREPVRDWRDLQAIKNQLVGEECEAVELYPAESRLVDTANQFHLWAFPNRSFRVPVGFTGRMVWGEKRARAVGAKQRDRDEVTQ